MYIFGIFFIYFIKYLNIFCIVNNNYCMKRLIRNDGRFLVNVLNVYSLCLILGVGFRLIYYVRKFWFCLVFEFFV